MEKLSTIVSVIIPTYNREKLVGHAINSVLNQTYQNFEIIIVDDASTDDTRAVVKGIVDPRINYICLDQNYGASRARNLGAEVARGKYFAFLDSDDFWYPEFLERQLAVIKELSHNVGMITCSMIRKQGEFQSVIDPSTRHLTIDGILMEAKGGLCCSSFLVRRDAFHTIGGFEVNFSSFQDFDFLLRMLAKYHVETNAEILMEYRLGKDSISVDIYKKTEGLECFINTYKNEILRLGVMHRYLFWLGQHKVLSGDLKVGRWLWFQALQYKGLDAKIWLHFILTMGGVGLYKRILSIRNSYFEKRNEN